MEAVAVMADRVKGVIDKLCCVREITTHSFFIFLMTGVLAYFLLARGFEVVVDLSVICRFGWECLEKSEF